MSFEVGFHFVQSFSFKINFYYMCAHMYYRRNMCLHTDERDVEDVILFNMYGKLYHLFIMR